MSDEITSDDDKSGDVNSRLNRHSEQIKGLQLDMAINKKMIDIHEKSLLKMEEQQEKRHERVVSMMQDHASKTETSIKEYSGRVDEALDQLSRQQGASSARRTWIPIAVTLIVAMGSLITWAITVINSRGG